MNAAVLTNTAILPETVAAPATSPIKTGFMARLGRELLYRQTVRALRTLDDKTLQDIGIERANIKRMAAALTGRYF